MVTRKRNAPQWEAISDPVEMSNGATVVTWRNNSTMEHRIVPDGLHPDDQPLAGGDYAVAEQLESVEETATDRVATMLQNASGAERAELKVYRVTQGQLEFCDNFLPQQFEEGNFVMLRDRFGAGEYELRLYATHPENKKFVVRNKTRVKIAEDKSGGITDNGTGGGMNQIMATIAAGQAQMLDALVQMKQQPTRDPMDEMTKMLSMMTMMREAMGMNQPSQKSSIGEIVGAIRELRGAADELAPEKEQDGLMGMLPKVLEMVTAGQAQQAQQPQYQPGLMPVELPQSFAQAQAPAQHNEGDDLKLFAMIKLKSYLKSLITIATQGNAPQVGAQFVYDKLPDELVELLFLDNWFELLSAVAPEVVPHQAWLTGARDGAMALFDAADAAEDEQDQQDQQPAETPLEPADNTPEPLKIVQ
jgi:hypothetical protein